MPLRNTRSNTRAQKELEGLASADSPASSETVVDPQTHEEMQATMDDLMNISLIEDDYEAPKLKKVIPVPLDLTDVGSKGFNVSDPDRTEEGGIDNIRIQVKRQRGKMRMAAEGAQKLYDACNDIVNGQVNLTSWQEKIKEEMLIESDINEEDVEIDETVNLKTQDTSFFSYNRYGDGVLTIGCIGQPNVGKSSLMNALMGKKVVSVSKTPGHTKHFQTIFLTKTVKLCDCPGLVFPSKVPKALQVLMGSFPIAQLRDPYTCVKYLAERMDLISILKIQHPEQDDVWSAMDICDGWAMKKGFYTARTARLDTYRAANHILRMALEGKIILCMSPPGYTSSKDTWAAHPDVQVVEWIQSASSDQPRQNARKEPVLSEEDDESEDDDKAASALQSNTDDDDDDTPSSNTSEEESQTQTRNQNKFQQLGLVE